MDRATTLDQILRPAGGGVYVISTGVAEQQALQKAVYRVDSSSEIIHAWRSALQRLSEARVVILGVPSDTGAGFTRGANRAPAALRRWLLDQPDHPIHRTDVTDAGDVRVVPQLLDDAMLSDAQLAATRAALYGDPISDLPVSPLDQCALALRLLYATNPSVVPVVIGGDHSVGWPAFQTAFQHWEVQRGRRLGLLHFDAHTDLLPERLGVTYCFATWAYHANELLGRDGRLVQVGIRASGHDRAHWESTLNVRQHWAGPTERAGAVATADAIIKRFERLGVDALYISNDIDGTDEAFAAATGTPEPGGLHPDTVRTITQRVAARFPLIGGDLVEVAPPLAGDRPGEPAQTLNTAAMYLADLIDPVGRHVDDEQRRDQSTGSFNVVITYGQAH